MSEPPPDLDMRINVLSQMTGVPPNEARQLLEASKWDTSLAADCYFEGQEDTQWAADDAASEHAIVDDEPPEADSSGGRTLGGGPAPASSKPTSSSAANSKPKSSGRGFATLGDLNQTNTRASPNDGEDRDSDDEGQDLFAGGEKSGLAVHNPADPKRQVRGILERARRRDPPPGDEAEAEPERPSLFSSVGHLLGGDDTPSTTLPAADSGAAKKMPRVARTLHFWQDGFSVEDGPLYRFDDPATAPVLQLIKSGRAPLDIMDVGPEQPVDVTVKPHEGNYVAPKKKYKPFSGGGQRLGSPTPGASTPAASAAPPAPTSNTTSTSAAPPAVEVDESQPTLSLQIRLGDGSRLPSRFNTTHTIGDVYDFVRRSNPASAERPWVLMTTFPSRELSDHAVTLGDLPEFKRGGVIVQRWQ